MKSFWNNNHPLQEIANRLNKLVDQKPFVNGKLVELGDSALEKFRQASIAYYDIFNNGGGNEDALIHKVFDLDSDLVKDGPKDWLVEHTNSILEKIVLAAAKEQGVR